MLVWTRIVNGIGKLERTCDIVCVAQDVDTLDTVLNFSENPVSIGCFLSGFFTEVSLQ